MNKKLLTLLVGLLLVFVGKEFVGKELVELCISTVEWCVSTLDKSNQERRDLCDEIDLRLFSEYAALNSEPRTGARIIASERVQATLRKWKKDGLADSKKDVLSALDDWVIVRDETAETIRSKGGDPDWNEELRTRAEKNNLPFTPSKPLESDEFKD